MKKIAVYGGAFNPPHKGHLKVIEYLLNKVGVDYVEVVPCGLHRHKNEDMWGPTHRFNMLTPIVLDNPHIILSDEDIIQDPKSEGAGSTYRLMSYTKGQWESVDRRAFSLGGFDLYCVIGQDNADSIESFYKWEELTKEYKFIVFPRGNKAPEEDAWYLKEPHIFLKDFETIDISSTELRKTLDENWIPKEVLNYIKDNNLYGFVKK